MFRRNYSPPDEASFLRARKRPETIANQACGIDQNDGSIMPAIFDLLYREYCRARLAEMRKQLLLSVQSHEVPQAIAMSAILTAPSVAIAVLATIGQAHSTKLATFTEPALL
jgi:hypothetical protein